MELDDVKKEYIRIREELESSKKGLEVINKKNKINSNER